jgi:predicted ATP-dependent endonuclease of OLD family
LKQCSQLNVLSGRNDVGKSNVLRALNLFFNGNTDWQTPLDFAKDFSLTRLNQVRKESVKGKQYIHIAIEFERPNNFKGSLPDRFIVKRNWYRDQSQYNQTDNIAILSS